VEALILGSGVPEVTRIGISPGLPTKEGSRQVKYISAVLLCPEGTLTSVQETPFIKTVVEPSFEKKAPCTLTRTPPMVRQLVTRYEEEELPLSVQPVLKVNPVGVPAVVVTPTPLSDADKVKVVLPSVAMI